MYASAIDALLPRCPLGDGTTYQRRRGAASRPHPTCQPGREPPRRGCTSTGTSPRTAGPLSAPRCAGEQDLAVAACYDGAARTYLRRYPAMPYGWPMTGYICPQVHHSEQVPPDGRLNHKEVQQADQTCSAPGKVEVRGAQCCRVE
ncbi:uncharacterized protein [Miscanthus floridulus]|uniref:uncharacterized protein n=1 Tax=Miscanthus floridulus TaxID=154761 RepID=UPI0034589CC7